MSLTVYLTIAAARNRQGVGAKMTRQTQQEDDSSLTSAQPFSISVIQTSYCLHYVKVYELETFINVDSVAIVYLMFPMS